MESSTWAVIVVGLPGDDDHAQMFTQISEQWREALISAGLSSDQIHVHSADDTHPRGPTREYLADQFAQLSGRIQPQDTLCVFWLGHANVDEDRPAFHVRGPDLDDADMADWLDHIKCRQQVVWLTHSSSGHFVRRLSRPSRIVIAATAADQEPNETEFPHALASVLKDLKAFDENQDGRTSVLEIFAAATRETESLYAADRRLPTEHAQLDDDGNGKGTELTGINVAQVTAPEPAANPALPLQPQAVAPPQDGKVAAHSFLTSTETTFLQPSTTP